MKQAHEIRNRARMAKKCTKKHDAHEKFLETLCFFAVLVAVAVKVA